MPAYLTCPLSHEHVLFICIFYGRAFNGTCLYRNAYSLMDVLSLCHLQLQDLQLIAKKQTHVPTILLTASIPSCYIDHCLQVQLSILSFLLFATSSNFHSVFLCVLPVLSFFFYYFNISLFLQITSSPLSPSPCLSISFSSHTLPASSFFPATPLYHHHVHAA